jgi:hypothetical protein
MSSAETPKFDNGVSVNDTQFTAAPIKEDHAIFDAQYIHPDLLKIFFNESGISAEGITLSSNATFHEGYILKEVCKLLGTKVAYAAALQASINGFHARSAFRSEFQVDGVNYTMDWVKATLRANPIQQSSTNKDKPITLGRLCRVFAPAIQVYLAKHTDVTSVLYRKFGQRTKIHKSLCFVGAEYAIKPEDAGNRAAFLEIQAMIDYEDVNAGRQQKGEFKWQRSAIAVFAARGGEFTLPKEYKPTAPLKTED